ADQTAPLTVIDERVRTAGIFTGVVIPHFRTHNSGAKGAADTGTIDAQLRESGQPHKRIKAGRAFPEPLIAINRSFKSAHLPIKPDGNFVIVTTVLRFIYLDQTIATHHLTSHRAE